MMPGMLAGTDPIGRAMALPPFFYFNTHAQIFKTGLCVFGVVAGPQLNHSGTGLEESCIKLMEGEKAEDSRDFFQAYSFSGTTIYLCYHVDFEMVRFKNRYIVIEVAPKDNGDKLLILKTPALQCAIQKKIQQLYGDFGQAAIKFGFTATYCNTNTRIALVRGRHGPHNFLTTVIPKITDIGGRYVSVKILHIGATMKHCFLFIKKHQQKEIELLWGNLTNDHDKQRVIDEVMTLTPAMKDLK